MSPFLSLSHSMCSHSVPTSLSIGNYCCCHHFYILYGYLNYQEVVFSLPSPSIIFEMSALLFLRITCYIVSRPCSILVLSYIHLPEILSFAGDCLCAGRLLLNLSMIHVMGEICFIAQFLFAAQIISDSESHDPSGAPAKPM